MKLTREERHKHARAEAILSKEGPLNSDDRVEVIEGWHEGHSHNNAGASAFFTPFELAFHLALNIPSHGKLLDLCSGIGSLTVANLEHGPNHYDEIVLVEINPDYCAVARRLLPEAEVICGSVYDKGLIAELASRRFTTVISNPPFGNISKPAEAQGPRFKGQVHYEVLDIASDLADNGAFILPQGACPFEYSGRVNYTEVENRNYDKFSKATGIELQLGVSVDTSGLAPFRGTNIRTELVVADFKEARQRRQSDQSDLFLQAA